MRYGDAERRIPAAAITTEDAAMIHRLRRRGIPVTVRLRMGARDEGEVPSANVVAELRGSEQPDEIVVMGGHLDSWDVGQGAQDDGGGCVAAMEALSLLRRLGLRPRRTIRVVLWTNEENGLAGAKAYAEAHEGELPRHAAAIESDSGVFRPQEFIVDLEDDEREEEAVKQLRSLLALTGATGMERVRGGGSGADVGVLRPSGVPVMGLRTEGSRYFDYHHTHADTFDKVDPRDLARNVAALAITSYVLADMPGRLGGTGDTP
jgi:carboxypeptidase Q